MKTLGILGIASLLYILGVFICVRFQYWKNIAKLEHHHKAMLANEFWGSIK